MNRYCLFLILGLLVSVSHGQGTLILQPDPAAGVDASLGYHDNYGTSGNNYGTDLYLKAYAIPRALGGVNSNRGVIQFDLSQLPTGATIQSAVLELYATGQINSLLPGHFGNNECWLRRITAPWGESTITWDNQPATTAQDQVLLTQSTSPTQDYSIDVTSMVSVMAADPALDHGMLLMLDVEDPNDQSGLLFYSSDWSTPALRPKLTITYENGGCSAPGAEISFDASLGFHTGYGTDQNNYGSDEHLKAYAIPGALGGVNANRGVLKFDMGNIPGNAIVVNAELRLFATGYINSLLPGHFGNNLSELHRIISPWSEMSVTWATAPSTSSTNITSIPQSSSSTQDYVVDVTDLVIDMLADPNNSFGFLMRMAVEDPNDAAALTFCSSDALDPAKWPVLCVEWHGGSGEAVAEVVNAGQIAFMRFDQEDGDLTVQLPEHVSGSVTATIFDASGRLVLDRTIRTGMSDSFSIRVPTFPSGVYVVRISCNEQVWTSRVSMAR